MNVVQPYQYWWWRREAFAYMQEYFYPAGYEVVRSDAWGRTQRRSPIHLTPMVTRGQIKQAARHVCRNDAASPRLLRDVYRSLVDTYRSTGKLAPR